jgi:hypothetical protein
MSGMKKFMVVHKDPNVSWETVQENWIKLAKIESATWVRTGYNKEEGVRYCTWLAPRQEILQGIFNELNISFESILEIEETVPDLWGKKWEEHLIKEAAADTLGN